MSCRHEDFAVDAHVNRLVDESGYKPLSFSADIRIHCTQCNEAFAFVGLPYGYAPDRPTKSDDRVEARLPIVPVGDVELPGGMS